jgi:hypothetical protein
MANKTPKNWYFVFAVGFMGVMMVALFAQRQPCTTCPIVQMIKGIKSCAVAETNATPANPEPNITPAESNQ